MPVAWKINGILAGTGHSLRGLRLTLGNQVPDVLTFDQPVAAFDGSPAFAFDQVITLTRESAGSVVTWFVGRITIIPRAGSAAGEQLSYEARGAWSLLERYAYLQNFKEATNPGDPASTLGNVLRGRVVLNQSDMGAKVSLAAAVAEIIGFAIASGADLQAGTIDPAGTIPFDEVTDLSCAAAITRLLQWAPDAVCWFDYSTTPPTFHCRRRASLNAIDLAVGGAVPFESIKLRSREDLQVTRVCLVYIATNRANEASWQVATKDVSPVGTTGRELDCLVRTIPLAGSVYDSTVLEQRISTDAMPSGLAFSGSVTTGAQFATLTTWWKKHFPHLIDALVTIRSFREGRLTLPDGTGINAACTRELTAGAITDWMESNQGVVSEQQLVTADIEVEIVDPLNAAKKERFVLKAAAVITATSANKSLYTFLAQDSFTPAEEIPPGLSATLLSALSMLQHDGSVSLVDQEVELRAGLGNTLNLTGSLAAWASMNALVQAVEFSIDNGFTLLSVGPPRQLGPDDLVELFRSNRSRQPVTSQLLRTTGKNGGTQSRQSLAKHHPVKAGSPVTPRPARVYTRAVTVAGTVPTATEFQTALVALYTAENTTPVAGDVVKLTVSGVVKFTATITFTDLSAFTGGGVSLFIVGFTYNSVTWHAQIFQTGLY